MKAKKLVIVFVLIICVIITYIPLCNAGSLDDPDEYYFEDVNVLIIGRCRTIGSDGSWKIPIYIGFASGIAVQVGYDQLERINLLVFNKSIANPQTSFTNLIGTTVVINDARGIFFWACLEKYAARLIPPIIFICCYAEKLWIY